MKILLCHSYYTQRGGEDRSFEEERELLQANGHQVIEYVRRNRPSSVLIAYVLMVEGFPPLLMTTLGLRLIASQTFP